MGVVIICSFADKVSALVWGTSTRVGKAAWTAWDAIGACVATTGEAGEGVMTDCRLTRTDSSPSLISISDMLDSSSISISFLTFLISIKQLQTNFRMFPKFD